MARTGRPRALNKALKTEICLRVADGETVRQIAASDHMPEAASIYRTLAADAEFRDQYALAREAQLQRWEDELVEIADDGRNDVLVDDEGNERVNHEHINRSRLRVDTRKWLMSKRAPKKYGEKLEHSGPDGGALTVQIVRFSDDAPAS